MKIFFLFFDQELEVGLKLAGCDAISLKETNEIEEKIDEIIKNPNIGILVINQGIYNKLKDQIDKIREINKLPLIAII